MSETKNLKLFVTDDSSEKYQEVRRKVYGEKDSNMVKIDNALSQKANLNKQINTVLRASAWSSAAPYTQSIADAKVSADSDGLIIIGHDIAGEQLDIVSAAKLLVSGQADGSLTITAYGDKPSCDIPAIVIIFG